MIYAALTSKQKLAKIGRDRQFEKAFLSQRKDLRKRNYYIEGIA
jgi:hypothetical protein